MEFCRMGNPGGEPEKEYFVSITSGGTELYTMVECGEEVSRWIQGSGISGSVQKRRTDERGERFN